jgi:hypothetical protein
MEMNLLSCLATALLISAVAAEPGVQASLSANVINDLLQEKLPELLSNITDLNLGGFTEYFEIALIKGHIEVENLTVKHVGYDPQSTKVTFAAPNLFSFEISDVSIDLTSKTKIRYGLISETYNRLEIKTKKASASLSAGLVATSNGSLQVDLQSFELKLGDLDVQTHTFFGLFVKLGAKLFKPFIAKQIKKAVEDEVPTLNKALASLSYTVRIPNSSTVIDLHLAAQPAVVNNLYYLIQLQGNSALTTTDPLNPTYDVQAQLSDSFVSSVLEFVWPLVNITISEFAGQTLTTDTVGLFLPGLVKTFGSDQPLGFHLSIDANYTPSVRFTPTIDILIEPDVEFLVKVNSTWEHAFTLHLQTNATANFEVVNSTLSAKVQSMKFTSVSYSDSVIGNINLTNLKFLLTQAVNIIVPLVNSKLANVTLPLDDIPIFQVTSDEAGSVVGAIGFGANLALRP